MIKKRIMDITQPLLYSNYTESESDTNADHSQSISDANEDHPESVRIRIQTACQKT